MKNFKTKFLGLALAGLILGACSQTGTYETADLMNEQAAANKAGFKLTPFGIGNENARTYAATDCVDFCIDPENPEYSMQAATISNNSGPQTRVFTYTVYNTLTGFNLDWSYAATNNAGRKLRVTVSGAGFASPQTYTSNQLNGGPGNGSNTFAFDASWAACGVVTIVAVILDGNDVVQSGPITTTYGLIGECSDCDIEGNEFAGVAQSCSATDRTAIYTFGSEEGVSYFKIQGGLNNFTGDDADVYINGALVDFNSTSTDGWATGTVGGFTVGQRTPGGSSNRNIRVEGGLGTCEDIEVKIVWNSSNSGGTITGGWSVKDANGVELAPEVAGLTCGA